MGSLFNQKHDVPLHLEQRTLRNTRISYSRVSENGLLQNVVWFKLLLCVV